MEMPWRVWSVWLEMVSPIFVQDLIVCLAYQRQGIGSDLMKEALGDYKTLYRLNPGPIRQKPLECLLGFGNSSTYDCTGMIWVDRKDKNIFLK